VGTLAGRMGPAAAGGSAAYDLPVEPAAPRLLGIWPLLALPPGAIVFFAFNQWLRRRGSGYDAPSCGLCS